MTIGGYENMKLRDLGVLLMTMSLLNGCGGSDETEISAADVTGTWVQTLSDGTETITLRSDMTYTKVIELVGDFPMTTTSDDTWSFSGNTISLQSSKYNTVSEYTVILEGNTMIWDNGEGQITYQKQS